MISNIFGKQEYTPSELKDPFNKKSLDGIRMYVHRHTIYKDKIQIYAYVKFENGNTTGEQKVEAESFEELIKKVEAFINQLS